MQKLKCLSLLLVSGLAACASTPQQVSYAVSGDEKLDCSAIASQIENQAAIEKESSSTITEASLTDVGAKAGGTAVALGGSSIPYLGNMLQINSGVQQSRIKAAKNKHKHAVGRKMYLESLASNKGCSNAN